MSVSKKKVGFLGRSQSRHEQTIQLPAIHKFKEKTRDFLWPTVWKIGYEVASIKGGRRAFYFTDNSLILYHTPSYTIQYLSYDNDDKQYEKLSEIKFYENIISFNFSPDKTKIYGCLAQKKYVIIINFNPTNNTLELTDEVKDLYFKN